MTITLMRFLRSIWDFIVRVNKRFFTDACAGRAAGLAFSTLFALVPLTAFVVAVLTAFGAFDPLIEEAQQALIQQLVPTVHEEVFDSVRQFASNTRALGFLGFFVFLATAVMLIRNINISLNSIWGFRPRRGPWTKIASYTSVIVIGTTLLTLSFALGPIVQSLVDAAFPGMSEATWFRTNVLPPMLFLLTVFSLNILVPAGKVRPASAAVGAVVTIIIWELAKRIFVFWTTSVMRLSVIYGSLAVLPIFLIWLYLSWFFILMGVEVAYGFQHRGDRLDEEETGKVNGPASAVLEQCIITALEVGRRHREGQPPLTADDLDYRLGAPMADRVRTSLEESGLFLVTDHGLLPSRHADGIAVADLVASVVGGGPDGRTEVTEETGTEGESATERLLRLWRSDPQMSITDDKLAVYAAAAMTPDQRSMPR